MRASIGILIYCLATFASIGCHRTVAVTDISNPAIPAPVASPGYAIKDVLIDGVSVGPVASYAFDNVSKNHTISASFAIARTITVTQGGGGTISPSGPVIVADGNSTTFTITPDIGYSVSDVQVDGLSVGAVGSYKMNNVTADHKISAQFAKH